jgi:hypothetical protein
MDVPPMGSRFMRVSGGERGATCAWRMERRMREVSKHATRYRAKGARLCERYYIHRVDGVA